MIKYELFNNEINNDNENICSLQIQIQAKKIVVDFFIRTNFIRTRLKFAQKLRTN